MAYNNAYGLGGLADRLTNLGGVIGRRNELRDATALEEQRRREAAAERQKNEMRAREIEDRNWQMLLAREGGGVGPPPTRERQIGGTPRREPFGTELFPEPEGGLGDSLIPKADFSAHRRDGVMIEEPDPRFRAVGEDAYIMDPDARAMDERMAINEMEEARLRRDEARYAGMFDDELFQGTPELFGATMAGGNSPSFLEEPDQRAEIGGSYYDRSDLAQNAEYEEQRAIEQALRRGGGGRTAADEVTVNEINSALEIMEQDPRYYTPPDRFSMEGTEGTWKIPLNERLDIARDFVLTQQFPAPEPEPVAPTSWTEARARVGLGGGPVAEPAPRAPMDSTTVDLPTSGGSGQRMPGGNISVGQEAVHDDAEAMEARMVEIMEENPDATEAEWLAILRSEFPGR